MRFTTIFCQSFSKDLRRLGGFWQQLGEDLRRLSGFWRRCGKDLREMGGAPRNPAPRNHLLVWTGKPSGCHCRDALGGKRYRRVPTPLRSTSPFSETCVNLAGFRQRCGEDLRRLSGFRQQLGKDLCHYTIV